MDYYSELYWMFPLALGAFGLGFICLFLLYRKGFFDKWLGH